MLRANFDNDPIWNYDKKMEMGEEVGLMPGQVKKWNYDEKKRREMSTAPRKRDMS